MQKIGDTVVKIYCCSPFLLNNLHLNLQPADLSYHTTKNQNFVVLPIQPH